MTFCSKSVPLGDVRNTELIEICYREPAYMIMDADNYRQFSADLQAQDPKESKVQITSKGWKVDNQPFSLEEVSLFVLFRFQLIG